MHFVAFLVHSVGVFVLSMELLFIVSLPFVKSVAGHVARYLTLVFSWIAGHSGILRFLFAWIGGMCTRIAHSELLATIYVRTSAFLKALMQWLFRACYFAVKMCVWLALSTIRMVARMALKICLVLFAAAFLVSRVSFLNRLFARLLSKYPLVRYALRLSTPESTKAKAPK